jgi:hypothetical protein
MLLSSGLRAIQSQSVVGNTQRAVDATAAVAPPSRRRCDRKNYAAAKVSPLLNIRSRFSKVIVEFLESFRGGDGMEHGWLGRGYAAFITLVLTALRSARYPNTFSSARRPDATTANVPTPAA